MKNRRSFQPVCSEIEALETRNLLSDTPMLGPFTTPVIVAPVSVVSVAVSPASDTVNSNNVTYWVTSVANGTQGQVAFVNVVVTITDNSGPTPHQVQQNLSTISVAPEGTSFNSGSVDLSHFPTGKYNINVQAYDLSGQGPAGQNASMDYDVNGPETSTGFFVVDSSLQPNDPGFSSIS